jgi:hypothetical protein
MKEEEGFGGEEEDGRLGRDGVLSNRVALVWLSMEDSVFERASIRFASFVGDEEGEGAGVIDSKILDKSRVIRGVFWDERVVSGGDGDFLARFGEPYVLTTLPGLRSGEGDEGCTISRDESRVAGIESLTISTDSFRRFLG